MNIEPIAHIKTDYKEKFGIPRQSGRAPSSIATIVFEEKFRNDSALKEIEGFTYLWLIFDFSMSHVEDFCPTVRPPRLGGNKKVGVFASRSPFRPNSLGLSSVKLLNKQNTDSGTVLIVSGADLLDGTPIYDIKPYLPSTDCHIDAKGGYAEEFTDYKLKVEFTCDTSIIPKEKLKALTEALADDPRPSYQEDGRVYGIKFDTYNIKFKVNNDLLSVFEIEKQ